MKYCNLIGATTIVAVTRVLSVIVTRPLRARWVWLRQTNVCMHMRNTIVEVASKRACSRLSRKTIPLDILKRFIHHKTAGALTSLFTLCMECCGDASYLRIPIDREESTVRKDKGITMAQ